MNRLQLILFLVASCFCFRSQAQVNKLIYQTTLNARQIRIDNLNNGYVVTDKNELIKLDSVGKSRWSYVNRSLGNLAQVDVTDPLRIVLYYPDFQQIVVLNNTLSFITSYSFSEDVYRQITLVCSSNTNGYWAFDQGSRELLKLSTALTEEISSGDLYQSLRMDLRPDFLTADDQYVYLHDKKLGVVIFDRFGKYVTKVPLTTVLYFQVGTPATITYFNPLKGGLMHYQFRTLQEGIMLMPKSPVLKRAVASSNRVMGTDGKVVWVWSVMPPVAKVVKGK